MNTQVNHTQVNNNTEDITSVISQKWVHFAGFDLTSMNCGSEKYGTMVQSLNAYDLDNIEITSANSTISDGGIVWDKRYSPKTVTMKLYIQGSSHDDLIERIDALKERTQDIDGNLDIFVAGEIRRYTATVSSLKFPAFSELDDFVEGVDIEFLITSPHWIKIEMAQTAIHGITDNHARVVANAWTYKTHPIIYIVAKSGTDLTKVTVTHNKIGTQNEYSIFVEEAIHGGQVLKLDYRESKAEIDAQEVYFRGIMTAFDRGQSEFSFDFEGDVNADIYILHSPTFL